MSKNEIIQQIKLHEKEVFELGIKSLSLFGSIARGDDTASSDVDIFYEFKDGEASLDHFLALKKLLEDALNRRVDLVSRKYVGPILEKYIQNEMDVVF